MKVLIVEDEPELSKSMIDYLSGQQYICELASNYNQAQAKWDKAAQELNTVLATISKTVSQGNDAMSDVNRRAAASWG